VPLGVTALLVIVLLGSIPACGLPDALAGFTSEVTFFLIGVAAIGTAVEASGWRSARALPGAECPRNPTRLYATDDRFAAGRWPSSCLRPSHATPS